MLANEFRLAPSPSVVRELGAWNVSDLLGKTVEILGGPFISRRSRYGPKCIAKQSSHPLGHHRSHTN